MRECVQVQSGDFTLSHYSMDPASYKCIMQVAVRMVMHRPLTWRESLMTERSIDGQYRLGATERATLMSNVDYVLDFIYVRGGPSPQPRTPLEKPSSELRMFLRNTNFAAYMAFVERRESLFADWNATFPTNLVAPLRAVMLARLMEWGIVASSKTVFKYLYHTISRGFPVSAAAAPAQRMMSFPQFKLEMQSRAFMM